MNIRGLIRYFCSALRSCKPSSEDCCPTCYRQPARSRVLPSADVSDTLNRISFKHFPLNTGIWEVLFGHRVPIKNNATNCDQIHRQQQTQALRDRAAGSTGSTSSHGLGCSRGTMCPTCSTALHGTQPHHSSHYTSTFWSVGLCQHLILDERLSNRHPCLGSY